MQFFYSHQDKSQNVLKTTYQTKQQVFNITMAMLISRCRYDWSDPVSHITGSFAGNSPSDLLKQYKFYFYWEGPRAHTHTQTNTEFLSYSVRQRKSISVVLPLDARISNVETVVLLLSLAPPPMPCISSEETLEKRQGTWL